MLHIRPVLRHALLAALVALALPTATRAYPPSARVAVADTLHGTVIVDPYRWLEEKNAPETRAWIEKQMAFTDSVLAGAPDREPLRARLEQLYKVDASRAPIERGGSYFYTRRRADQQQSVLYVQKGLDGPARVLVDPSPWNPEHTTSVRLMNVSPDGKLVAFGVQQGGEDEVEVHFMDVEGNRELPDRLPKRRYLGMGITADRGGVFYSCYEKGGSRVREHRFGQDPVSDATLFGEGYGPEVIIGARLSDDGRWLVATVSFGSAGDHTEIYAREAAVAGPLRAIVKGIDAGFDGEVGGDQLYVETRWKAPKGRVIRIDLRNPDPSGWQELVPEAADAIESFELADGKLVVQYLHDVASTLRVFDAEGKPAGEIPLPTLGSASDLQSHWSGRDLFFGFSSFVVPPALYRRDLREGKSSTWWSAAVPVRPEDFETRQVWYSSKDGTRIPMFVVSRKGLRLDGRRPTLLTGYGGFNVSEAPDFSRAAVAWAERGGVYAVPALRGGGEYGEAWHKAGMLGKKQNVFDDFLAAAEWLSSNGVTDKDHLAISGGSNGGLLVGAAMTQRPDLFRAVLCSVPLFDMLRFHRFLVARFWVPEYGSSEDAEQFKWLHAYSPYQRVVPGTRYPAVMFSSGDSDTRVDPLHARKGCALLQAATGSGMDRPVLLHYDTKSGHAGGKPVSQQITDSTIDMLFLAWQTGLPLGEGGKGAGGAASGAGIK